MLYIDVYLSKGFNLSSSLKMATTNIEEREVIYLMPNSQPDVVRNEGQVDLTSSDQESRKSKKWTIPAVIVAIIIAIGIIYKLIKVVFKWHHFKEKSRNIVFTL